MPKKPILCLDFDGVMHSYTSGWKGATEIPDSPVPGLFEFLEEACKAFDVQVFSSRSHEPGGIEAMRIWIAEQWLAWTLGLDNPEREIHGFIPDLLTFPKHKPSAFLTLDDRAWTFNGAWPDIKTMQMFRPWNKQS